MLLPILSKYPEVKKWNKNMYISLKFLFKITLNLSYTLVASVKSHYYVEISFLMADMEINYFLEQRLWPKSEHILKGFTVFQGFGPGK